MPLLILDLDMQRIFLFFILISLVPITSCEKEPGEGGRASITGKVYVQDYNGNCTVILDEFYVIDEPVFIIAGDDPSYFERIRTGPGGTFWFPYLRTGTYTVYALSKECDVAGKYIPVEITVEITGRKEQVVTEDIIIKG